MVADGFTNVLVPEFAGCANCHPIDLGIFVAIQLEVKQPISKLKLNRQAIVNKNLTVQA
jgi:hypothetical protein